MSDFRSKMRHAFAVDAPGPAEPETAVQREVVDRLCREILRRQMSTPTLMALEMVRPLNYLTAQVMHVFTPFLSAISKTTTTAAYEEFALFLERRGSIDYICRRLEALEAEAASGGGGSEPSPSAPSEPQD